MDAIDLLKHDHRMVEQLFRDHRSAATPAQRKAVLEILVRELSKHAAVEELLFYPFADRTVGREEEIKRHLQEHMTVKRLLAELDSAPDRPPALAMAAPVAAAYDRLRDRLQSRPRT
ncbi:hemerythrin domain-containing protein [Actinomadura verrucosospora]|uniref:Hemerythrin HHE cation binding domain-containing protein n=1 Tax=Actinomadura verrucosospora TaxID=46165 RepID=A0A7D3VYL3_ACTVE|nr:hemerythrin domain-containing protein [Actinomadura verrucosospora]QKG26975.1 hemerythrin HHE cation binding domain-containing protein [Actinomadura verrucosospora]